MLFDLRSGKRRRLVQVVYSLLAASFLIGFVFLGIGTGVAGFSFSDLFGSGGGSTSSAYQHQIDHAQAQLKKDPKNPAALENLARYEFLTGQAGVSQDPTTGQVSVSSDSQASFAASTDAWSRYVKVTQHPNAALASQIAQAYVVLNDANGAAQAQRIFADAQPSTNSLGTLAIYEYAAGDFKAGDAAAKQAVAKAPKSQRSSIKKDLNQRAVAARKFAKQQKKAAKASAQGGNSGQLQNPFGGLSPATPTTPTTP